MIQLGITTACEIFHLFTVANGDAAASVINKPFLTHIESDARDARTIDTERTGDLFVREL